VSAFEKDIGFIFHCAEKDIRHRLPRLLLILVLAGCTQPERTPDAIAQPPLAEESYEEFYLGAARQGAAVYRIETPESRLLVRVGRAGGLKYFGHEHAIASEDIEGMVMLSDDPEASRADLRVPLKLLVVDNPEYRARIGLEGEAAESAIDDTYNNMQNKVLESAIFPWAQVNARFASALSDPPTLRVTVTLHGIAFEYLVPVDLQVESDRLVIKGHMTIQHEDFGLTPFSSLGGLLRVAEQLELEFFLVAKKVV
jgi:polyisoprenoid-binding protein YceI